MSKVNGSAYESQGYDPDVRIRYGAIDGSIPPSNHQRTVVFQVFSNRLEPLSHGHRTASNRDANHGFEPCCVCVYRHTHTGSTEHDEHRWIGVNDTPLVLRDLTEFVREESVAVAQAPETLAEP